MFHNIKLGKYKNNDGCLPYGRLIKYTAVFAAVLVSGIVLLCGRVCADEEQAYFGSEEYSWEYEEYSAIGVYASSTDTIDSAVFTVTYDPEMLEYEDGGTLVEEGEILIELEDVDDTECKELLYFTPVTGGETTVTIESVQITSTDDEITIVGPEEMPVTISLPQETVVSSLSVNGSEIEDFAYETLTYYVDVDYSDSELEISASPEDVQLSVSQTSLVVGTNTVYVTAASDSGSVRYTLVVERKQFVPETTAETESITESENESEASDESFAALVKDTAKSAFAFLASVIRRYPYICAAVIALILFEIADLILIRRIRKKRRKRKSTAAQSENKEQSALQQPSAKDPKENSSQIQEGSKDPKEASLQVGQRAAGKPERMKDAENASEAEVVINVCHVTMDFRRDKDESSSLKELLIRMVKGKRQIVSFRALDDISFSVLHGEVVGIIGTNGSGKSTILKIISGALQPTKGKVEVDRGKIQLLTLGTGFDHELTGRENVYLNGALIGYSREFIDEHFDEIVEFAELDGFMDEKVKNYSSGMISRLGFSIATIRKTPEILILDEVLSVGDMFFRQKSMARIKEMIHGGSTVLIVSHSTGIIKQNCSKVIWIEQGKLKMIGTPSIVCRAYETMKKH